MKLQFDARQQYQLDAISSIVDVFSGQPLESKDFEVKMSAPKDQLQMGQNFVIGNRLLLSDETLLENLQTVQKRNELEMSDELDGLNFSVEMETGTGKTYVYLRTIHELHKNYGFKKFVIVVPSIAIKEGVLKNLEITADHFSQIYDNPQMDFSVYDSKQSNGRKRSIVRNFARNNSLQVLVINIDSFAKEDNIINQGGDGIAPIKLLQGSNPVVIVDEPQNMETPIRKQAIKNLNPLCTLRYSATHKNPYNLCYKLDPVQAYDLGLVKKIEVDSVLVDGGQNEAFIEVVSVTPTSKTITIKLKIYVNDPKKGVVEKVVSIKKSPTKTTESDLYKLSNEREVYKDGYTVSGYDVGSQSVSFTNGKTLYVGESQGEIKEDLMKFQIEKTVQNHFDKERALKDKGIKVLTLFFIDKVANYREYENGGATQGKFAIWFEEAFNRLKNEPRYADLISHDAKAVHNGYFAKDKKTGSWKDSRDVKGQGGKSKADDDTYSLIMKDKERLLSLEEPLRFIFSHSALREGWDNPNVFQICTLNESRSDAKKRQEIGRGLRLPVDKDGKRVFDRNLNILTVTANESYEDFAKSLQSEIEKECGVSFGDGRIKDKRKRQKVNLKKGYQLDPNFKDLWERISHETRYQVTYDTNTLIEKAAQVIENQDITPPKIRNVRGGLGMTYDGIETSFLGGKEISIERKITQIPDILGYIQSRTHLTKDTILKIILQSGKMKDIFQNPQAFMDLVADGINRCLTEMMVSGIKYERIAGKHYQMERFEHEELQGYLGDTGNLIPVHNQEKTLYDHTLVDSAVEGRFAQDLETREDVKFYIKLPWWFTVKTPIGSYNPDWAIVFEDDKRVYFVAETKGSLDDDDLRTPEKMKIQCGKKHFAEFDDVEFKKVTKVSEIMI